MEARYFQKRGALLAFLVRSRVEDESQQPKILMEESLFVPSVKRDRERGHYSETYPVPVETSCSRLKKWEQQEGDRELASDNRE